MIDAAHHLPLVYKLARDTHRRCPSFDFDDLVSAGAIGLCEAAKRYHSRDGSTFATFAWLRINGAMVDWMRKTGPYRRADVEAVRQGEQFTGEFVSGDLDDFASKTIPPEETIGLARDVASVQARVAALPEKERRLLCLMYGPEEMNLEEAGRVLGMNKSWACRLRARAFAEIRAAS